MILHRGSAGRAGGAGRRMDASIMDGSSYLAPILRIVLPWIRRVVFFALSMRRSGLLQGDRIDRHPDPRRPGRRYALHVDSHRRRSLAVREIGNAASVRYYALVILNHHIHSASRRAADWVPV